MPTLEYRCTNCNSLMSEEPIPSNCVKLFHSCLVRDMDADAKITEEGNIVAKVLQCVPCDKASE